MPTNVTFNGTTYAVPDAGGYNWQALSAFLLDVGQNAGLRTIDQNAIRVATTSPVTISSTTDYGIVTDLAAPGPVAVSLPAGVNGQVFVVLDGKGDASTNSITITPNGAETINGAATLVLDKDRQSVILQYSTTGTQWRVLGSYFTTLSNAFTNPMTLEGDMIYQDASGVPERLPIGAANTVLKGGTFPTYDKVTNADVASSAAIAYSKLNLGTSVVNADINAAAAIAGSKVTPDFSNQNIFTTTNINAGSATAIGSAFTRYIGVKDTTAAGTVYEITSGTPQKYTVGAHAPGLSWYDETNTTYRMRIKPNGELEVYGNLLASGTLVSSTPNRITSGTFTGATSSKMVLMVGVSGGCTIQGIAAGVNGQIIWVVEDTGNTATLVCRSTAGGVAAANRLWLGTAIDSTMVLATKGVSFVYSSVLPGWILVS